MGNEKEVSVLIKMRADIDAAISKVNNALDKIGKKGNQSSNSMAQGFKKATKPIADMNLAVNRAGLIWGIFAGAVIKNVTDISNKIDDLDRTSLKLGLTAEELSRRMYGFNMATKEARNGTELMAVATHNLGSQWAWAQTKIAEGFGLAAEKIQFAATFWGNMIGGGKLNLGEIDALNKAMAETEKRNANQNKDENIQTQVRFAEAVKKINLSTFEYNKYLLSLEVAEYKKAGVSETEIREYQANREQELLQQRLGFKKFSDYMDSQFSSTITSMKGTMSGFFNDAFHGQLKKGQEYFAEFGNSILKTFSDVVAEMITRWLIFSAITGITNFFGGGAVTTIATAGAGAATKGKPSIDVNILDTYYRGGGQGGGGGGGWHKGGVIKAHSGLAVDDVPAVLQTGEGVLSRRGMAALGKSNLDRLNGADQGVSKQTVNYFITAVDAQSFVALCARNPEGIHMAVQKLKRFNNE